MKIEKRNSDINADNDNLVVSGYACVFDTPTVLYSFDGIDYKEIIDRHAFDGCDFSKCCFRYNHSDSFLTLARTHNKTLVLKVDDKGLHCTATLADIQAGQDLYKLIQRGDINKMSFAFVVAEDSYNRDTCTRTILKISTLYDVSAVDIPAYDDTCISARDYFSAKTVEIEQIASDKRRRLLLATYLF